MLKIHDIKPIVEIPDFTIYIYYGLICFSIIFLIIIGYTIFKMFNEKQISSEKEYYNILETINFDESKQSSYLISKYGRLLAKTPREIQLINDIHLNLEQYKYKRNTNNKIETDIQSQFTIFMDSIDVK